MTFGTKNTQALTERRRHARQSVAIIALVHRVKGAPIPLDVEIISSRGFLARSPELMPKGVLLRVAFPSGRAPHVRVVWLEDGKVGCEFLNRVSVSDLLVSAPARPSVAREFARKLHLPALRKHFRARILRGDQYELF